MQPHFGLLDVIRFLIFLFQISFFLDQPAIFHFVYYMSSVFKFHFKMSFWRITEYFYGYVESIRFMRNKYGADSEQIDYTETY